MKRFILILAGGIVLAVATEVPLALADCAKGEPCVPQIWVADVPHWETFVVPAALTWQWGLRALERIPAVGEPLRSQNGTTAREMLTLMHL